MQAKTDAAKLKSVKHSAPAAAENYEKGDMKMFSEMGNEITDVTGSGNNKRLSVERIYQKKSQLEHILLRPDTYIGSVESVTQVNIYTQLQYTF